MIKCAEELENQARNNLSLELYNLYCASAPADQVNKVCEKFNSNDKNIDLSSYSAICIANVLRKFIRELPDTIIPVQWYDKFLEASSKYSVNALLKMNYL